MGILESIKKGFSVTASSLPVVLALFVFGFIFNLINMALLPKAPNTPPSPAMIAAGVVFVLLTIFMQAGSMGYVRDKLKQGNAAFSHFLAAGSGYYVRIFLLSLVIALVIGAFVLAAALAAALLGPKAEYAAIGVAIVIAAIGVYTLILLFFAPYIAVSRDQGVIFSLKESVRLVRANPLKVVGISLLLVAIGFLVGLAIGLVVGLLTRVMPDRASQILFAFLSSLVNAFLGLFVTASFMSFYLGKSSPQAGTTAGPQ